MLTASDSVLDGVGHDRLSALREVRCSSKEISVLYTSLGFETHLLADILRLPIISNAGNSVLEVMRHGRLYALRCAMNSSADLSLLFRSLGVEMLVPYDMKKLPILLNVRNSVLGLVCHNRLAALRDVMCNSAELSSLFPFLGYEVLVPANMEELPIVSSANNTVVEVNLMPADVEDIPTTLNYIMRTLEVLRYDGLSAVREVMLKTSSNVKLVLLFIPDVIPYGRLFQLPNLLILNGYFKIIVLNILVILFLLINSPKVLIKWTTGSYNKAKHKYKETKEIPPIIRSMRPLAKYIKRLQKQKSAFEKTQTTTSFLSTVNRFIALYICMIIISTVHVNTLLRSTTSKISEPTFVVSYCIKSSKILPQMAMPQRSLLVNENVPVSGNLISTAHNSLSSQSKINSCVSILPAFILPKAQFVQIQRYQPVKLIISASMRYFINNGCTSKVKPHQYIDRIITYEKPNISYDGKLRWDILSDRYHAMRAHCRISFLCAIMHTSSVKEFDILIYFHLFTLLSTDIYAHFCGSSNSQTTERLIQFLSIDYSNQLLNSIIYCKRAHQQTWQPQYPHKRLQRCIHLPIPTITVSILAMHSPKSSNGYCFPKFYSTLEEKVILNFPTSTKESYL